MKFGIGEIVLILFIAFVVLLVVRLINLSWRPRAALLGEEEEEEENDNRVQQPKTSSRFKAILIGVAVFLLGVIVLISSLSLVKWVFWGPVGAVIAITAGVAIVLLARQR